jgi:hypothetical protein
MLTIAILAITHQIGILLAHNIVDAGCRGHDPLRCPGLRVFTAGQERGVTDQIERASCITSPAISGVSAGRCGSFGSLEPSLSGTLSSGGERPQGTVRRRRNT